MVAVRGRGHADPPSSSVPLLAPHELGRGRLEEGIPNGRPLKVLRIDVTDVPSTLIGRLLVGSYITGQDQVLVTAKRGLTTTQRREIHRVVDRLLGMSVVGDSPAVVEVANFVDAGRYEHVRLLHHLVQILRSELDVCHAALVGGDASRLEQIERNEEEIDQTYLLMARQLLLSSDSPRIAREIDVQSHHYQIGYRLLAKVLEVTGDLVHGVGSDLQKNLAGLRSMPPSVSRAIVVRIDRLEELLVQTMAAFAVLSVVDANAALDRIAEALPKDALLGQMIARRVADQKVAVAAQRIVSNLIMALEMLVIANEVTINRSVEPETVALTDTRVSIGVRGDSAHFDRPHASAVAHPIQGP